MSETPQRPPDAADAQRPFVTDSPAYQRLLKDAIRAAPAGDLHVFGYGSLMWRPGIPSVRQQHGILYGYNRRLAVYSTHYRGTEKQPGLVFGLDRGGSCHGIVHRIAAKNKVAAIDYLFAREMFRLVYLPRYLPVVTRQGRRLTALTFIVCRKSPHYAPPLPLSRAAKLIRKASGHGGKNTDYILNTGQHLSELGIHSPFLKQLCAKLAADG